MNDTFVTYNTQRKRFEVDDRSVSCGSSLSTRWLVYALEKARPYARGRLLDIGCGTKPYSSFFAVTEHIGVDWPSSSHELKVEAYANAEALPFASAAFDTVLCTEVIEHLPNPRVALADMMRVLRPGGYLILSAPFIHVLHELPFDYFRYTYFGLQDLMRNVGLIPVVCWHRGGSGTVFVDLFFRILVANLRKILRKVPFGRRMQPFVLDFLVVWPQRLFALATLSLVRRKMEGNSQDAISRLTLGYVLVAQRPQLSARD